MSGSHTVQGRENCIDECTNCQALCLRTTKHCLELGEKFVTPGHIRLLLDCAQICRTSADFMLRGSPLHAQVCAVCAEICDFCALDCERFPDDELMRQCAEACRQCERSCAEMAQRAA